MAKHNPRPSRPLRVAVPSIPCDAQGPVFQEPWQAQAFAMALALHKPRRVRLERLGDNARRRKSGRRRLRVTPTPGQPTIGTGSLRWSGWWRRRVWGSYPEVLARTYEAWGPCRRPYARTATPIELRPEDFR